jgi:hypothetical protein
MNHFLFNIGQFETSKKKFVHFLTDSISVSVLLGEECINVPKWQSTKRKQKCDDEPVVSSTNYDITVGLDPSFWYIFATKTMKTLTTSRNWSRWLVDRTTMIPSSIGTRESSSNLTRYIKSG